MKKLILLISVLSFYQIYCNYKFEFQPLIFNFKGIEAYDDYIIIYGNSQYLLQSNIELDHFKQSRATDRGKIINCFKNDESLITFNDIGDVSGSKDGGYKWEKIISLNDSITFVLNTPENHYIRTKKKIIKADKDFKKMIECPVPFIDYWSYDIYNSLNYRQSMAFVNGNLIVQADSSMLIKFDSNLNPIDTLSFKALKLCDRCQSSYNLYSDSTYIYIRIYDGVYGGSIYRTKDFKNVEKFMQFSDDSKFYHDSNYSGYTDMFKVFGNNKYCINITRMTGVKSNFSLFEILSPDTARFIKNFDITDFLKITDDPSRIYFNDFIIINNRLILISDDKLLYSYNLDDISDYQKFYLLGINIYSINRPVSINDSTFLLFTNSGIYKTDNGGRLFERLKQDSVIFNRKNKFNLKIISKDEIEQKINIIGYFENNLSEAIVFSSKDSGSNWKSKSLKYLTFNGNTELSNLNYNDNFNRIAMNSYSLGNKHYTQILTFDNDFNFISRTLDSNYFIKYIYSFDENSYLINSSNSDNTNDIKYTTDRGFSWNLIRKYNFTEDTIWIDTNRFEIAIRKEFLSQNEVRIANNKYLLLFSFNKNNKLFSIEVVDLALKKIEAVYKLKISEPADLYYAVESDNNNIYLALNDTLIIFNDFFNINSWRKFTFPDKGFISNKQFYKVGNSFICLYSDRKLPLNQYLMQITDTTISDIEVSEIERLNYLFSYPPFPTPAYNEINSVIYWDPNIDIDNTIISVFNVNGLKVEDKENILIKKLSNYHGILTWNCINQNNGIYFLQIKYGSFSNTIKILIHK